MLHSSIAQMIADSPPFLARGMSHVCPTCRFRIDVALRSPLFPRDALRRLSVHVHCYLSKLHLEAIVHGLLVLAKFRMLNLSTGWVLRYVSIISCGWHAKPHTSITWLSSGCRMLNLLQCIWSKTATHGSRESSLFVMQRCVSPPSCSWADSQHRDRAGPHG